MHRTDADTIAANFDLGMNRCPLLRYEMPDFHVAHRMFTGQDDSQPVVPNDSMAAQITVEHILEALLPWLIDLDQEKQVDIVLPRSERNVKLALATLTLTLTPALTLSLTLTLTLTPTLKLTLTLTLPLTR